MRSDPGLDRLARAMSLWLEHTATGGDPQQLRDRHPDLHELLDPLLAGAAGDQQDSPTTAPIGDFRILRELGRGGMGVVHEARQLGLDRRVALKVLHGGAAAGPRALARFHREATTAARLVHPGIVAVHAVGEAAGAPWFAMELIEGERLDRHVARLRSEQPDEWLRRTLVLAAAIADALQFAHEHGVVHRDVKPSNILVRADGTPVVTDFGLAHLADLPSMSRTGEFAGTPGYVSPEQARGDREVTARSDVFSLGVTLYELLTGTPAFRGATTRAVLDDILRRDPPPPSRVARELPRALDAVIGKALAKEPRRRYATAAAFAADLRRFLAHRPVDARLPSPFARARLWARREPLQAALTVAVVALALGAWRWQSDRARHLGNADLAAQRVEDLLLQATIGPMTGMARAQKQELLATALQLAGDDPYAAVAVAIAELQSGRAAAATAHLDAFERAHPTVAAVQRLRRQLAAAPGSAEDAIPPVDALDHYVAGMELLSRAVRRAPALAVDALRELQRAVAMSPRPRAMLLIGCNQAGRAAGDQAAVRVACDALAFHWPQSAAAHCYRSMAWTDADPELAEREARASLDCAPDNFLGLYLLGELVRRKGDVAAADGLFERAATLHPEPARFVALPAPHSPPPGPHGQGR